MSWKDWNYTEKGGLIGFIFGIIFGGLWALLLAGGEMTGKMIIWGTPFVFMFFIILGGIIGFIVQRIKNRV